jgi:hypothetical protein
MLLPFLSRGISFVIDSTPDPVSFTAIGGQTPSTWVYSNIVQITGINVPVTASASGGSAQLQVSSDAAGSNVVQSWASSVTVTVGQYLRVRLYTGGYGGTTTANISIGLYSTT